MDGFTLLIFGGVGAILLVLWIVGKAAPGNGSEQLGLNAREIEERRIMLELEDDEQVREALESIRSRRAARESGEPLPETD